MSTKFGKRPLRSLSAHEKMDAIRRVHDGESKASVARDIGVPESTLRGWCKNEDKILYLSRQSTPETDDSGEPKEKKQRFDITPPTGTNGVPEPYNLSVKIDKMDKITPLEVRTENGSALNLTKDQVSPKMCLSERERNRAELARLSIELGLNRPEMFMSNQGSPQVNLTDNLMTQWNQAISQIVNSTNKVSSKLRHSLPAQNMLQTPLNLNSIQHLPKTASKPKVEKLEPQQNVDDSVWQWLKTQQAMLGLMQSQNGAHPNQVDPNGSWFWKWYKQFAYTSQAAQDTNVLYQQLTKDPSNAENHSKLNEKVIPKTQSNTKARAVLDNLLLNNNNNEISPSNDLKDKSLLDSPKDESLSPTEALEHGEKFLKWLECFSDPSVTAMQVLQFRYLLNNVKSCTDRKTTPEVNKMKVKRK